MDKKLKVVKGSLTAKQRAFVKELSSGKPTTLKQAYANAYDVTLNKDGSIPVWVEREASLLAASPKIAQSLKRASEREELAVTASALRTKSYVLERLLAESQSAESDASRVRALELLGKSVALFSDVIEDRSARDAADIEKDIEDRLSRLLAS